MIIDAHIHLFPDPIAQRAIPHLASICKSPAFTDGTLAQTEQKLRETNPSVLLLRLPSEKLTRQ